MKEYEGKIRFVMINYPYHYRDYSFGAAEALLTAGEQGKYWEMHDLLLEKSPDLSPEHLVEYGKHLMDIQEAYRARLVSQIAVVPVRPRPAEPPSQK